MRLNKITKGLIKELKEDCRQPYTVLAKKLGVNRETISNTIRKMEQQGQILFYTILVDYTKLGYEYYMVIWLNIEPHSTESVMLELSKLKEIHQISNITGKYDIFLLVSVKNRKSFYNFMNDHLAKIKGINSIESEMILTHYMMGVRIEDQKSSKKAIQFDDLDRKIIKLLQSDGRISYTRIGNQLNMTSPKVVYRITRMIKQGIIKRFTTAYDYTKLGYHIEAYIYLKVDPMKYQTVLKKVINFKEVLFAMETSGYVGLLLNAFFLDRTHFREFLSSKIATLEGIQEIRTYLVTKLQMMHYV